MKELEKKQKEDEENKANQNNIYPGECESRIDMFEKLDVAPETLQRRIHPTLFPFC